MFSLYLDDEPSGPPSPEIQILEELSDDEVKIVDTKQETLDMLPNLYGKSQITLKSPKTELLPFRAWPSKREYTLNIFENLSEENDDGSTSKIVKVQENSSNEHENYEISRELLENCDVLNPLHSEKDRQKGKATAGQTVKTTSLGTIRN